jgi:hypothetical protein
MRLWATLNRSGMVLTDHVCGAAGHILVKAWLYTTPNTQGSKKIRNKNFCESEDIILVKAWLDTSIDAIPCIN